MNTETPYSLTLEEILPAHADIVGGKALSLALLRRAGFNVPDAVCITSHALQAVLSRLGQRAGTSTPDLALLRSAPLPEPVLTAIRSAYSRLGDGPVAVRSSAPDEDQPDASFAGQYNTYLNVQGFDAVLNAVRACWASLWNERAAAYRSQHRQNIEPTMSVIIQRQVAAEASGVLFTLNPLTGREEEMVIEASWGVGEGIVSGKATPDRFVVDPWHGRIVDRHVADKRVMVVAAEASGVRESPVPPADRDRPALSDGDLLRLAEIGLQIQELYGRPQDVEWAFSCGDFFILQARPLTSYTFAADIGQWTSANFREIMPGLVNPLSFSTNLVHEWGAAMDEFFTRMHMQPDKKPVQWSRTFFGRAYWNVGEVKRRAALIPGFRERSFDITVGVTPTYDGDGQVTPFSLRTLLRGLPILLSLNRLYATIWKEADAEKRAFLARERDLMALSPQALSNEALIERVREVLDVHFRVNRIALLVSFLSTQAEDDFHQTMERLNHGLPPDQRVAMGDLLTGLGNVSTARPLLELWQLAEQGLEDPALAEAIRRTPTSALLEHLQTFPRGQSFAAEIRAFLQRYAYMASGDEDFSAPRWGEEPTFVLNTLKRFVEGGKAENPSVLLQRQQATRRQARERVRRILERNPIDRLVPLRRRAFLAQMLLLHRYCWWREETRDVLARAHYQCHRFIGELGKRWAAQGLTSDAQAIFHLTRAQLLAVLDGTLPWDEARCIIARSRRFLACYRNVEPPIAIGGRTQVAPSQASRTGVTVLTGVACSPGRATGPARIITSLDEAGRLQRGDILVAPYLNPGWTPLFSLVAAVVVEEGGLLSHGAVIARECGIPAVLHIEQATRLLRDGQIVRVDGGLGTVEIIQDQQFPK